MASDMVALGGLILGQMRGRLRRWLRMVKQPKYFIGLAVGLLYYGWFVIGRLFAVSLGGASALAASPPELVATLRLAVSAGIAGLLTLGLLMPGGVALPFEEAELH